MHAAATTGPDRGGRRARGWQRDDLANLSPLPCETSLPAVGCRRSPALPPARPALPRGSARNANRLTEIRDVSVPVPEPTSRALGRTPAFSARNRKAPERAGRAQSGVCSSWMGLFAWDRVLYVGDRARLRSLFDMKSARLSHHQARRWNGVQSLPKPRRVPRSGTGTVVGGLGKVAAGHAWLRAATSAASVQGQPGPNPDYHPGALSSGGGTISRFT